MPDDLGESVLDLLFSNVRGAVQREASQEEHRAERVSTWSWFFIPNQEPVQMIESRVLERHCVESSIVWRPVGESMLRPYGGVFSIVESNFHSSPSLRL